MNSHTFARSRNTFQLTASEARFVWQDQAACRGMDTAAFFPEPGGTSAKQRAAMKFQVEAAVAVCGDCPVQRRCLQYAGATRSAWGIWGGRLFGGF
jgi:WhiB family redox-sensing transcriptional regulator